jgi:hypothetical protein
MTRAKASRHRPAAAALPGRSEIQARTLITEGYPLRDADDFGARRDRIDLPKIGHFEAIAQVNAFASFHCWQHVGLVN